MQSIKLSVVIITFNEENNIKRCLDSIKEIADEIIVLDSYSSDKTADICKLYNATFIQHKFLGHIEQKNEALSHANYDYVLSLDADEALSKELSFSIQMIKKDCQYKAYSFNRLTFYKNLPIKTCGWYPDAKIRLWDTKIGKWGGINPHDKVVLEKSVVVKHLDGDLLHYSFSDFLDYIDRQIKYGKLAGQAYYEANQKLSISNLLLNPLYRFFRDYFIKLGFIDGHKGLMISLVSSFTVFIKYYTYFEIRKRKNRPTVGLIISTYNWPEALELVLQSVSKQAIMPDQIIITDDGSGESTRSLIDHMKLYLPNITHCWQEDDGFRKTIILNQAIKICETELIIQIDGDMILHPDFVKDHLRIAEKGYYTQGSRVLTNQPFSERLLNNNKLHPTILKKGISNKVNGLHVPLLQNILSYYKKGLKGTRGCNMAFWKSDIVKVNGYNQDIIGWGKEDTELIVRLYNNGVKRKNLKFGGIQYHIYHPENSRDHLESNIKILENAIEQKIAWCQNGIVTST